MSGKPIDSTAKNLKTIFPSLVSVLLQDHLRRPSYTEARVGSYETVDHLHLFDTISAPDLLNACKTRRTLQQRATERDLALGCDMTPDGEGIVGPYDDDDRETLMEFTDYIRTVTLHRHAKLVPPPDLSKEYAQPYGMDLGDGYTNPRLVLDITNLDVDDNTRGTLDACSWLLQSDQWEEPSVKCRRVTVSCNWDMVKPLLQTVRGLSVVLSVNADGDTRSMSYRSHCSSR
jgi:hypothetical protein